MKDETLKLTLDTIDSLSNQIADAQHIVTIFDLLDTRELVIQDLMRTLREQLK